MSHSFAVADEVRLAFGFFDQDAAGTYSIVRLLPSAVDGAYQYRIKDKDGRERVISEDQIVQEKAGERLRPRSAHNPITEMFNR